MTEGDFIGTIGDDDEVEIAIESSDSDEEAVVVKTPKKKKSKGVNNIKRAAEFNVDFHFDDQDDDFASWQLENHVPYLKKKQASSTLDDKIDVVRRKNRKEAKDSSEDFLAENEDEKKETVDSDGSDDIEEELDETDKKQDKIRTKEKKKKKKLRNDKIDFAEEVNTFDSSLSFQDMNLSRPLLKALSAMNFNEPTPIQSATIPIALLGKDICACAATGTGKTAAFMLPVLERLLYKPKQAPVTRVLVLTPTRELAVQIYQVSRQLSQFTNIEVNLSAGGLDLKAQEAALRQGPDIVIATPGRLIDHLHNSPSFNLRGVEILILDEADRMLDEYFAEQMKEVIRLCSLTRQTMLFSATMTDEVKDLAAVSLKEPVKVFVNENTDVALNLKQEFVRIRPSKEGDREAIVAALVTRTFQDHCMVFIQTKKQAHRMHILLGLLGIKVGELHGALSQQQRLDALKKFKEGEVDILLATDLAARGLDIQGVKTVINFTMPNTFKHYIHRVGRTARAGRSGRSVTLAGESERNMLKEVVKKSRVPVKSRLIPQDVIEKYRKRISKLEPDIESIDMLEQEEKEMRAAEIKENVARKRLEEKDGALERPRTWFQSHKERMQEQERLRLDAYDKSGKKKNMKDAMKTKTPESRVNFELEKSMAFAKRFARKGGREKRKRAFDDDDGNKMKTKKMKKSTSSFAKELTSTSAKAVKKLRSKTSSYEARKELQQKSGKKFKPGKKNRR